MTGVFFRESSDFPVHVQGMAIKRWLMIKRVSPMTGQAMGGKLVPNHTVHAMILKYKREHGL